MDFAACTAEVFVVVERLPKCKQGFMPRFSPCVDKNTNFWIEDPAKGIKQPPMRVDLFAVFLLQAKDHLDRREIASGVAMRANELEGGRNRKLRRIFKLLISTS